MVPKSASNWDPLHHICLSNLHRIPEGWLAVLHKTKTRSGSGPSLRVLIPYTNTLPLLCPVKAVDLLISVMHPKQNGPLLLFAHHKVLLYGHVRSVIREWASSVGFKLDKFGTHSARSGSATTAFKAGVSSSAIMLLGDWLSNVFLTYLRQSVVDVLQVQMQMMKELQTQLTL